MIRFFPFQWTTAPPVVLSTAGFELTSRENRLHFTMSKNELKFTMKENRLNFKMNKNG